MSYSIDTVYDATNDRILACVADHEFSAVVITIVLEFSSPNPKSFIAFVNKPLMKKLPYTPFDLMIAMLSEMRAKTTPETAIPYHVEQIIFDPFAPR